LSKEIKDDGKEYAVIQILPGVGGTWGGGPITVLAEQLMPAF